MHSKIAIFAGLVAAALVAENAQATSLITNGSFEEASQGSSTPTGNGESLASLSTAIRDGLCSGAIQVTGWRGSPTEFPRSDGVS